MTRIPTAPRTSWHDAADASGVLRFGVAAFVLSWVPWGALLALGGNPTAGALDSALWILGGFGPALAAVAVAWRDGPGHVRQLLAGLLRWRVGARWYAALLIPLGVGLLAATLAILVGSAQREAADVGSALLLIAPLFLLNTVVLGGNEEIGWRGYALPRLQQRMSALAASLLLGIVWVAWHAPLFFMTETTQRELTPPMFVANAMALSAILTWLYNGTAGSLLLAVLFHGAINTWYSVTLAGLVPDSPQAFVTAATIVAVAFAIGLVALYGPRSLSRGTRSRTGSAPGVVEE